MVKGKGNRKRVCKSCGKKTEACNGYIAGVNFVCCQDCAFALSCKVLERNKAKQAAKIKKKIMEDKKVKAAAHRKRKQEVKPLKYFQDKLQRLVNQWVVQVRDKGKPCCTCGESNSTVKYDAGHYRTRAACPELRYELTNIHLQCSVKCNQHGSGMRKEYRDFIVAKYGKDHLGWIDGRHEPLSKDKDWYIEQIKDWRDKLRQSGVNPVI